MNLLGLLVSMTLAIQPPATGQAQPQAPAPQATVPTAAPPAVPEKEPIFERKTAYGFLLGGAALTGAMVWSAGLVAASKLDSGESNNREVGRVLPIPVVGPFIATNLSDDEDRGLFAVQGLAQMFSLSMMITGAVAVHQHRMHDAATGKEHNVKASTAAGMIGGGLALAILSYGMTVGLTGTHRRLRPTYGRRFYIPVFGGIAAAPQAPSNTAGVGALTSSAVQMTGVGLAAAGIALMVRRNRRKHRVTLTPSFGRGHAQLNATVRF